MNYLNKQKKNITVLSNLYLNLEIENKAVKYEIGYSGKNDFCDDYRNLYDSLNVEEENLNNL